MGTPAVICLAGFGFVGYIFNLGGLQVSLDRFFSGLNSRAHTHDEAVAAAFIGALPYVGGLLGLCALYIVVTTLGIGRKPKARVRVASDRMSAHEFAELARQHGVEARVARETYRILSPEHGQRMRVVVTAELEGELGMDADAVGELYARVARAAERDGGAEGDLPATVLGLMQAVERRPERVMGPENNGRAHVRRMTAGAGPVIKLPDGGTFLRGG